MTDSIETPLWITDRCRTEKLPNMDNYLWMLPYFDYMVIFVALPLFLLQRAPFRLLFKRMATMYSVIQATTKEDICEQVEKHRTSVRTGGSIFMRVRFLYSLTSIMKLIIAPLGIVHLVYFWIIKMYRAQEEQDEGTPCYISNESHKCFIVNIEELKFYYHGTVFKSVAWMILYALIGIKQVIKYTKWPKKLFAFTSLLYVNES